MEQHFFTYAFESSLWVAANEIRIPVLIVHGEKAHSRYFGEDAFKLVISGKYAANKQLLIVPVATYPLRFV